MATVAEALSLAVQSHQCGNLAQAEQLYRQVLHAEPGNADALHLLGLLTHQVGRHDLAVPYVRQAVTLRPLDAAFRSNLGLLYQALGRLLEAEASCREALRLRPDLPEAHLNLGNALQGTGRLGEAEASYRAALRCRPGYPEAHNNLGAVLREEGRLDEGEANCREALRLRPDYPEAHNNLGNVLQGTGRLSEAEASYREACRLRPSYAEAHKNLGDTLQRLGRLGEAEASCREALRLRPRYAEACNSVGAILHDQGRLAEAEASCREALRLMPDFPEAHNNLGNVLQRLGRIEEAIACYRRALELKPDTPAVLGQLIHQLQRICLWQDLAELSRRAIEAVERNTPRGSTDRLLPLAFLALPTPPTTAAQQLRCACQWVDQGLPSALPSADRPVPARPRRAGKRITLGYLSADFHEHATARLTVELFEKHDREGFVVFGYSYGPDDGSSMRRRLEAAFDRFAHLKDASFVGAARRVEADGVDILVDLKGYTRDARTQILALRPAPVQVNYLGYPGTMGAPFMDYVLVDEFVVPPDQQPFFTEKLVHLPGCYQVNDSRREICPTTPSRAACGLPAEGFVFCCFNNNFKITPAVFDVWMALLQAVRGSVLWLLEGNRFAAANLRREAEVRGLAATRLVFAPLLPPAEHLARHRLADLFLDTFPYTAHTTASDALWAGCPVLTMAGETFVSRVAGSLLRSLGLPELVTTSLAEYQATALRLAHAPDQLADLRARLETNRQESVLFDAGRFARGLEKAYVTMWDLHLAGERPRAFAVNRPAPGPVSPGSIPVK